MVMNRTPSVVPFGTTPAGEPVSLITLTNNVISCQIITYGAAIRSLFVPDRSGTPIDVVLGYDTLDEYMTHDVYLGATIGRFANRIAEGHFKLNGKNYSLSRNNGDNHLHGGKIGFSHRVWEIEQLQAHSVTLTLTSPDGEEGYPGNLEAKATYAVRGSSLFIRYQAVSDADTPCSLTNHSYFNLAGHNSGDVLRQEIALFADCYTPSNGASIPFGTIEPVEKTPMDLRSMTPIGRHVNKPFVQLEQARGYDHNYVLNGKSEILRPCALASCKESGISMDVSTTLPGLHFYTANFIENGHPGKGGCSYGPRHAFCLETQQFPDAPNQPAFPSAILKAGSEFDHWTVFSFSAR